MQCRRYSTVTHRLDLAAGEEETMATVVDLAAGGRGVVAAATNLTTREEEAARGRWREMVKLGREAVAVASSLLQ
jgi:hypothetical protein